MSNDLGGPRLTLWLPPKHHTPHHPTSVQPPSQHLYHPDRINIEVPGVHGHDSQRSLRYERGEELL